MQFSIFDVTHNCDDNNASSPAGLSDLNPFMWQEPNNLKSRNSFRFNGLVHKKTVGVQPAADGKGVVVVLKKRAGRYLNFPSPGTSCVCETCDLWPGVK